MEIGIEEINTERLSSFSLKEKDNLKERLESNLKIQKMLYNYEKSKSEKENER